MMMVESPCGWRQTHPGRSPSHQDRVPKKSDQYEELCIHFQRLDDCLYVSDSATRGSRIVSHEAR